MMKLLSIFALFVALICAVQGQYRGTVRLFRSGSFSSSYTAGIVQIYYFTSSSSALRWGNICDDTSFGYSEANVICNQLGYNGVSTYGRAGSTTSYGTDTTAATILDDVNCFNSSYLTLQQCSLSTIIKSSCTSNSEDAYVSCYITRIWNNPYSGQIRLQGGTYSSYGRLEVYCNGQWGTVCDDSFGATDARAACRQLGYSDYSTYTGNLGGSSSQPIWLDNVICGSSSSCLAYCESCPATQYHDCGHSEDVALGCEFDSFYTSSSNTLSTCQYADSSSSNRGTVRLIRNGVSLSTYSAGIVQIYYGSSSSSNSWGNICDDISFGYSEANVICNQLGYNGVSTYGRAGSTTSYGTDTAATILDDVNCFSSYLTLQQCSLSTIIKSSCTSNSEDAYVSCYTTRIWDNPYSGQIRLQGGTYSSYGRLEVYCNGQWGTVCDDTFGLTDARVACRQLGYSDYSTYTGNLAGSSSQPIWLNRVYCSSYYSCLATCESCPSSRYYSCSHSEDVALGCEFSSSYTSSSNTLSTCQYADSSSSVNIGGIIGGIIAGIFVFVAIIVAIPICICCCLGVGVGAAARGSNRTTATVVTGAATTTDVVAVSTTTTNTSNLTAPPPPAYDQQPPPPAAYPATGYDAEKAPYPPPVAYPAAGYDAEKAPYPPQQGYPAQPGYPPQQGYPAQPGYPPQQQGYGYPPPY